MLTPSERGADTLIKRMGTMCKIETRFYLAEAANVGDTSIQLTSSIGLDPVDGLIIAHTNSLNPFEIGAGGSETVTVAAIDGDQITLLAPLTSAYPAKSVLFKEYALKCMPLIKSTDVTREDVEFIRRVRVRKDVIATYGSKVYYQNRWFFVTGYDISDLTLLLKLREIGEVISIVSAERSGKDNGYGFDQDSPRYLYKWVPCWFNHLSSSAEQADPGYLPETYQMVIIPGILDVNIGDYILRDNGKLVYRVTGIDNSKVTGFHNLTVNLDNSVNLKDIVTMPAACDIYTVGPGDTSDTRTIKVSPRDHRITHWGLLDNGVFIYEPVSVTQTLTIPVSALQDTSSLRIRLYSQEQLPEAHMTTSMLYEYLVSDLELRTVAQVEDLGRYSSEHRLGVGVDSDTHLGSGELQLSPEGAGTEQRPVTPIVPEIPPGVIDDDW